MNARSTRTPYSAPTLVGVACILLIMAGPLISACDSGGSNGGSSSSGLVPLEQGNRWEVEVTGRTVEGPITGSAVIEMASEEEADASQTFDGNTQEATLQVSQQSGEGLVFEIVGPQIEVMRFKYPVEAGDTYQYTDGDENTFDISVSRTSVSVPAGDFDNCLQYEIRDADDGNLTSTVVFKPGVGPVRWDAIGREYKLTSTNVDG